MWVRRVEMVSRSDLHAFWANLISSPSLRPYSTVAQDDRFVVTYDEAV